MLIKVIGKWRREKKTVKRRRDGDGKNKEGKSKNLPNPIVQLKQNNKNHQQSNIIHRMEAIQCRYQTNSIRNIGNKLKVWVNSVREMFVNENSL